MNKVEFINYLKSLPLPDLDKVNEDDYEELINKGINYAFDGFNQSERCFIATFIKRFPHIFYNRLLNKVYGVDIRKKIDNYTDEVKRINWEFHRILYFQYVGPFFYINNRLRGKRMKITCGRYEDKYINHPLGHYELFKSINLDEDDDYGHYPRGRVIYNNMNNEFYIYVDKSLYGNEEIIKEIKKYYNLSGSNVRVRKDEHYTYDRM